VLGPGPKQIMRNFRGGTQPTFQPEHKLEAVTVASDHDIQIEGGVKLYTSSGARVRVSLVLGNNTVLMSPAIALPIWDTVPSSSDLYAAKRRGLRLTIPLEKP